MSDEQLIQKLQKEKSLLEAQRALDLSLIKTLESRIKIMEEQIILKERIAALENALQS